SRSRSRTFSSTKKIMKYGGIAMFNRVTTVTSVLCLVVLCMVLPVTASASDRVSKYVSDSTIKSIVERNVEKHHLSAAAGANIQVAVDDHVSVLSGTSPSLKPIA